jgi:WD40 repeat protein
MPELLNAEIIQLAKEEIKQGRKNKASQMLYALLRKDSNCAEAWFLYAETLDDPISKRKCLERALFLRPDFEGAQTKLLLLDMNNLPNVQEKISMVQSRAELISQSDQPDQSTPSTDIPTIQAAPSIQLRPDEIARLKDNSVPPGAQKQPIHNKKDSKSRTFLMGCIIVALIASISIVAIVLITNLSPLFKNQVLTIKSETGVSCSIVSEDGSLVALEEPDGNISLWNAIDGNQQIEFKDYYNHPAGGCDWVNLSFSPDGTLLAAASKNSVRLWNVKSGEFVNKIIVAADYPNLGEKDILQTAISPDNQFLVVVFKFFVEIYGIRDSSLITTIDDQHLYRFAGFSPHGDFLLLATSEFADVFVYDFPYLKDPDYWYVGSSPWGIENISFAPDQKTALRILDNQIDLIGERKYEKINLPSDSFDAITSVNFTEHGNELIFANRIGPNKWDLIRWNIETGENETIATTPSIPGGSNCEFSHNMRTIICSTLTEINVWNMDNQNGIKSTSSPVIPTSTSIPLYGAPPTTPEQITVDKDLAPEFLDKMMIRNIRYATVSNDGTQAVVQVLLEKLLNGVWTELEGKIVLWMIGGEWRSDSKTLTLTISTNGTATLEAIQQSLQATQVASQNSNLDIETRRFLEQLGGTLVYVFDGKVHVWKPDGSHTAFSPLNGNTNGNSTYDYNNITIAPDGLGFYFYGGEGVYYSNLDGTELKLLAELSNFPFKNDILVAPDNSTLVITAPEKREYWILLPSQELFIPRIKLENGYNTDDLIYGIAWSHDSRSLLELVSNEPSNDKLQIVLSSLDSIKKVDNLYYIDTPRPVLLEIPLQAFVNQTKTDSIAEADLYPFTGHLSPNGENLMFDNLQLMDLTTGTLIQLKTSSCDWVRWDKNGNSLYLLDPNSQTVYQYDIVSGSREDLYRLEVPSVWKCEEGNMDWLPK